MDRTTALLALNLLVSGNYISSRQDVMIEIDRYQIDLNGSITKYSYDNLDRVKSELWVGNGQTFTYTYDKNGNR